MAEQAPQAEWVKAAALHKIRNEAHVSFVESAAIEAVKIIQSQRFYDERGFFSEVWSQARLDVAGINLEFVQDNHSLSTKAGTLRGLHFQSPPRSRKPNLSE